MVKCDILWAIITRTFRTLALLINIEEIFKTSTRIQIHVKSKSRKVNGYYLWRNRGNKNVQATSLYIRSPSAYITLHFSQMSFKYSRYLPRKRIKLHILMAVFLSFLYKKYVISIHSPNSFLRGFGYKYMI